MALLLPACGTTSAGPSIDASHAVAPSVVLLPPGPYYEVIWASEDTIAAAANDDVPGSKLELFDSRGARLGVVSLDDSEQCNVRIVLGLSRLPSGGFAFTDSCDRPPVFDPRVVSHVYGFDTATSQRRELPHTVGVPTRMAWSPDEAGLVYGVGLTLCQTLYRWTPTSDGPLAISVVIDGQTVRLGENITDEVGRCVSSGQSREPAINPIDGALAAFVQPPHGRSGQDKIDLPWSLVVVSDGVAVAVLDGLRYARCLAWTKEGDLVFSADTGQHDVTLDGVYRVNRDGSGLMQIGTRALEFCSLTPDGSTLIGTEELWPPPADVNAPSAVLSYLIEP